MKRVLVFLFLSVSTTTMVYSQNLQWIPFTWKSISLLGRDFDKATMNIPITIEGMPNTFTMQFDLGATNTAFYENALKPFLEGYPSLNDKLDTTKTFWYNGTQNPLLTNVNLRLGEVAFEGVNVGLYRNYGAETFRDSINPDTAIHIGTIGADLVQNKILIIDYKANRLAVTASLPAEYENTSFEDFEIGGGRIRVPFRINGKIERLMFDTGASMFSLVTSKQHALAIGGTEIVDSLTVTSWGEYVPFYGLETVAPVMFGDKNMGNSIVYYNEDTSWDDFYKSENIWGITGNAYFFNDVVIVDYKNKRFGIR